jgi:putative transposase
MEVTKGYRVRIYPNQAQQQSFVQTMGACRWIYNHFLEEKRDYYLEHKKTLTYGVTSSQLTQLRKEIDWLGEIPYNPLQQSLRLLDTAYSNFFRKTARFPRFKSKKDLRQSFRKVTGWSIEGNKLHVAAGMSMRFRGTFPTKREGTLTISRTADGKWYASTLAKFTVEPEKLNGSIGLDMGIKSLVVTSEGESYPNLPILNTRREQKSLSRKVTGSKARDKARSILARKHNKIANIRKNYLHHISKAIVSKNHAVIAVEDLAVKNLQRNHKLARSISHASWGELLRQLKYKQEWIGGKIVAIDRFFPSSKTCSNCRFILNKLPLSVRTWDCPRCHTQHDRDINAAKMILQQAGYQLGAEAGKGSARIRSDVRVTRPVKLRYAPSEPMGL